MVKQVKSNAIVLWKDDRTVGIGAGQMNRVGAANIAVESAGENSRDLLWPLTPTSRLGTL